MNHKTEIPPLQKVDIVRHLLKDDGIFPNHALLPLLLYKSALPCENKYVEETLESNHWTNTWRNGIYNYHHYHSTAHEVLVVTDGTARVQFGGPSGVTLLLEQGDVVIIPAGVAHKNVGSDENFECIGAYPEGQEYDMNYGKESERPEADQNIGRVRLPTLDPVYGADGPLIKNWVIKK